MPHCIGDVFPAVLDFCLLTNAYTPARWHSQLPYPTDDGGFFPPWERGVITKDMWNWLLTSILFRNIRMNGADPPRVNPECDML